MPARLADIDPDRVAAWLGIIVFTICFYRGLIDFIFDIVALII